MESKNVHSEEIFAFSWSWVEKLLLTWMPSLGFWFFFNDITFVAGKVTHKHNHESRFFPSPPKGHTNALGFTVVFVRFSPLLHIPPFNQKILIRITCYDIKGDSGHMRFGNCVTQFHYCKPPQYRILLFYVVCSFHYSIAEFVLSKSEHQITDSCPLMFLW